YQNHVAASSGWRALPRGPIHADLFRDNVMFDSAGGAPELTGFFDFYFAGCDTFLFDIGVSLNDWCIHLDSGAHDAARADAFLAAYQSVRRLSAQERALLPAMLRAGALRFWISRLWDFHLPREAALLQAHDPGHFERVLRQRAAQPSALTHTGRPYTPMQKPASVSFFQANSTAGVKLFTQSPFFDAPP
nr:phosphotransferase [Rhodoferax sp.]